MTPAGDPNEAVGRRVGAAVIDLLLMIALFIVMGILFGESDAGDDGASINLEGGGALLYFLVAAGYYIVSEAVWGKTLGKRLLGIRVVKEDGSPAGWGGAIVRNLLRIVDNFFFFLVGLITIMVSKKKQRVGDMAAKTVVVRDA